MESTTTGAPPPTQALAQEDWAQVLALLPADLEASARTYRAVRRRRGIATAAGVLRLAFLYALLDWSLRQVGFWANVWGICNLSDVAILKRLRACHSWLGALVVHLLIQRGIRLQPREGCRLRIIDATVISQPGSQGTDWRLHLAINLGQLCLEQVLVSDGQTGESLRHFAFQPGEIVLADRIYAHAGSLAHLLQAGAQLVVRVQWNNLALETAHGQPFDVLAWLRHTFGAARATPAEIPVRLATPHGPHPLRLVALPLPAAQAEQARTRARQRSRKHHRQPDPANLYAAGFVLLLTNLDRPEWDAAAVGQLYRWRWQIEWYIKRLKSLLGIDHLRSRDPHLAQTYLLTKLLGAILLDSLRSDTGQPVPDWLSAEDRPVSIWRLDRVLLHLLLGWVLGPVPTWDDLVARLPHLRRYLCDPPRKRRQQLACARAYWAAGLAATTRTIC